jgi:hypothetical protein
MAIKPDDVKEIPHHVGDPEKSIMESASDPVGPGDLLSLGHIDHALTAKMNLVNDVGLLLMVLQLELFSLV